MKRVFTLIVLIALILSLFMTSALADKPEKTPKPERPAESQTEDCDDPDDGKAEEGKGPKNVNEKRDAKKLFREETRPLIDEVHANREEWGLLGEQQGDLGDCIDAQIESIIEQGGVLDEATIAFVKEKMEQIKALKGDMKGLKGEIHDLWREYITAKKASNIDDGKTALNALIEKQEQRITIRKQIVSIMDELAAALNIQPPAEPAGADGEPAEA